jgi:hypothetical protein
LSEGRRFDPWNIVPQIEINRRLFQVRLHWARQEVETIDGSVAKLALDEPKVRLNPFEFQASRAEESKETSLAHSCNQLLGGNCLVHGTGQISISQPMPASKRRGT